MKKIICMIMALAMVLSMIACQSTPEQTETSAPPAETQPTVAETEPTEVEASTEAPTEPDETRISAEKLLQSEDTVTVTYTKNSEYEKTIHDLGYTEFVIDYVDGECACTPVSLTYNDKAFRLDFDYVNWNALLQEYVLEQDWIMYGVKADNIANVSPINFDEYQYVDSMDLSSQALKILNSTCFNFDDNYIITAYVFHSQEYYPDSGNLYNLVRIANSEAEGSYNVPHLLDVPESHYLSEEEVEWENDGLPSFQFAVKKGTAYWTSSTYYYEEGMTLIDWCNSIYNIDNWIFVDDDLGWLYHDYEDSFDGKPVVVMIAYNATGGRYTIDEIRYDSTGYVTAFSLGEAEQYGFVAP